MYLVTAAAGNVGREVVRALLASGLPVRAADRKPERLQALFPERVDVVALDFEDPSTFGPAVGGCAGMFLMRPPSISDVEHTLNPLIDAARAASVSTIVFLSVAGAANNKLVPHHAVERKLIEGGPLDWVILRPGFFAQNFEDAYRRDIVEDDRIFVPAGAGKVTFVDVRDIASVAVSAFREPERHRGRAHTLTGPDAISFAEAATMLSRETGRTIRYEPASLLGYVRHLRARGLPAKQIIVQTILHAGLRYGQASTIDPTLATLVSSSRTLPAYFRDRAALFRAPAAPGRTTAAG